MPPQVNKAPGRGKKKGLTHREIMHKRHLKKKKKEKKNNKNNKDRKMKLLKEYHGYSVGIIMKLINLFNKHGKN